MRAPGAGRQRIDIAFDRRCTSHMSAGMTLYVRQLMVWLPRVAPDLRFAFVGDGDNFDLSEQVALPLRLAQMQPCLAHIPTPFVPLALPGRFVLTIHDLIDLHYPQFGKRKVGPYYRFVVGAVARRAQAVITDDAATVGDLHRFLRIDRGRVRIVPLGVDSTPPAPWVNGHARPFFLFVGNHRPHKNLATLVEAWAQLPAALAADLYFTGFGTDCAALSAAHQRVNGRLVFVGDCSAGELVALYGAARAYVHPALREGFGLPLLEAMRAGAPVIAARSALPQVLAPYAQAFEATNVSELRELLLAALLEPQALTDRAMAAQAATMTLTWEQTARATVDVYREFLA